MSNRPRTTATRGRRRRDRDGVVRVVRALGCRCGVEIRRRAPGAWWAVHEDGCDVPDQPARAVIDLRAEQAGVHSSRVTNVRRSFLNDRTEGRPDHGG